MSPDGHRSEGTLSLSEVPYAGAKPFRLPFRRLEKVTRCKSETASSHHRSNGYAPKTKSPNPNNQTNTDVVNDTPHSRASPLPQGDRISNSKDEEVIESWMNTHGWRGRLNICRNACNTSRAHGAWSAAGRWICGTGSKPVNTVTWSSQFCVRISHCSDRRYRS